VRVGVQGNGYGGVPKHLGHYLRVDVFGKQQRGACMPKVVETYLGQSRPPEQGLEAVCRDEATVEGLPRLGGEYEAVLLPQITRLVLTSPEYLIERTGQGMY
jgi:hypothetical protein